MEQITYQNVTEKILEIFPEYRSSESYFTETDKDSPYVVLGSLSLMALGNDIGYTGDTVLAERLVQLTDEILNDPNSDDELINLFQIEVLESLTETKTGAMLAKRLLHGKSLELLEQTLKHYYTDEFLEEYRK